LILKVSLKNVFRNKNGIFISSIFRECSNINIY